MFTMFCSSIIIHDSGYDGQVAVGCDLLLQNIYSVHQFLRVENTLKLTVWTWFS